MRYITNVLSYIDPSIIEYVKTNTGIKRPLKSVESYQEEIYRKWIDAGYCMDKLNWEFFNTDNIPDCDLTLPFQGKINWWISKLNPGDMFPFHTDSFPEGAQPTRYWIACEDHAPGHVFMYGNKILSNYKAGDVYELGLDAWHGACNIGFTPKMSIQVVLFNN